MTNKINIRNVKPMGAYAVACNAWINDILDNADEFITDIDKFNDIATGYGCTDCDPSAIKQALKVYATAIGLDSFEFMDEVYDCVGSEPDISEYPHDCPAETAKKEREAGERSTAKLLSSRTFADWAMEYIKCSDEDREYFVDTVANVKNVNDLVDIHDELCEDGDHTLETVVSLTKLVESYGFAVKF